MLFNETRQYNIHIFDKRYLSQVKDKTNQSYRIFFFIMTFQSLKFVVTIGNIIANSSVMLQNV